MRVFFASLCAVMIGALVAPATPARAAGGSLTGKMASNNLLLGGSWNCLGKASPSDGQPVRTSRATVTFNAVPGNVFHVHVSENNYDGDSYYGFNSKSNLYWEVDADNTGSHGYLTSTDGDTYTGVTWTGTSSMNVRTTYKKMGSKAIVHQVFSGAHGGTFDAVCNRK